MKYHVRLATLFFVLFASFIMLARDIALVGWADIAIAHIFFVIGMGFGVCATIIMAISDRDDKE